jgi:hypothetical protein
MKLVYAIKNCNFVISIMKLRKLRLVGHVGSRERLKMHIKFPFACIFLVFYVAFSKSDYIAACGYMITE